MTGKMYHNKCAECSFIFKFQGPIAKYRYSSFSLDYLCGRSIFLNQFHHELTYQRRVNRYLIKSLHRLTMTKFPFNRRYQWWSCRSLGYWPLHTSHLQRGQSKEPHAARSKLWCRVQHCLDGFESLAFGRDGSRSDWLEPWRRWCHGRKSSKSWNLQVS